LGAVLTRLNVAVFLAAPFILYEVIMDDKPLLMNAAQAQIALGVGRKAFKELEKNVKIVRLGRRKMYQWKDLTSGLEKMKEEPCTSKEPDFTTPPKSRRTSFIYLCAAYRTVCALINLVKNEIVRYTSNRNNHVFIR
jgi:hypothetical protein